MVQAFVGSIYLWVHRKVGYSYAIPMGFVPVYYRLVVGDRPYAATHNRPVGFDAVLPEFFEVANFHLGWSSSL